MIWILGGSAAVIGGAAIIMFITILWQRVRYSRQQEEFENERHRIQPILNAYLDGDISETDVARKVGRSTEVAERLILDLLEQMVGEDRQKLLQAALELGLVSNALSDLNNPDWTVRDLAAQKLGVYGLEETVDDLSRRLLDNRMEVRYTAARSLGLIGSQDAVEALVDMLGRPELIDASRVLEIVQSVRGQVIDHLRNFLDDESQSQEGKLLAIDLVGDLRDTSTAVILHEILKSSSKEKVVRALKALGKIGAPMQIDDILQKANSPDWEVRAQVAKVIGQLEIDAGIPLLRNALADESYWVRYNAAQSLASLGGEGLEILQNTHLLKDRYARDIAKYQLEQMGLQPKAAEVGKSQSWHVYRPGETAGRTVKSVDLSNDPETARPGFTSYSGIV